MRIKGRTCMKNKRTSKKKTILLLAATVLIAVIVSTAIAYYYMNKGVQEAQKIPMDIKVQEKLSFNLDADALHFGGTNPGGSANRGIVVVNKKEFPLKVRFYMSGEIGSWVLPENIPFYLLPFENKTVMFTATVPKSAAYGNYTGELTTVFKKV